MEYPVEVRNVTKKFKRGRGIKKLEILAVHDVSFEIYPGEILGLLGPNGAGKTTLVRLIATLLIPDSGIIKIMGKNVLEHSVFCRSQIGLLTSGERTLYWKLSARENLKFFAALYGLGKKETEKRINYLIELLGLKDVENERVEKYSSGMKQKLSLARALIHDPKILLLDEPTLGLDPQFARFLREFIKEVLNRQERKTILLTTHYMFEADELCSRIAFINQGRIVDCKTPREYKESLPHNEVLEIQSTEIANSQVVLEELKKLPSVEKVNIITQNGRSNIKIILPRVESVLSDMITLLQKYTKILTINTRQPTLEDVFIYVTGRGLIENDHESLTSKTEDEF
jgi:ABC-2 type transport system ATP-binding protein